MNLTWFSNLELVHLQSFIFIFTSLSLFFTTITSVFSCVQLLAAAPLQPLHLPHTSTSRPSAPLAFHFSQDTPCTLDRRTIDSRAGRSLSSSFSSTKFQSKLRQHLLDAAPSRQPRSDERTSSRARTSVFTLLCTSRSSNPSNTLLLLLSALESRGTYAKQLADTDHGIFCRLLSSPARVKCLPNGNAEQQPPQATLESVKEVSSRVSHLRRLVLTHALSSQARRTGVVS